MKVLVVGSGGREHAIIWALHRTSEARLQIFCAPGNGGIAQLAECVPIAADNIAELIRFATESGIELTVVGPEAPLAEGIVDAFEAAGLRIMGATRSAARLEASKVFAKDFMQRHAIPTARYAVANSATEAVELLRGGLFGSPDTAVVLKADGLAAGKGVIVAKSRAEGERAIDELTSGTVVDVAAAKQIVIEEALTGTEVSVLLFADGRSYALMPPARDHKRIGEGDSGPNTGGMGAITDATVVDEGTLQQIAREVVEPTLKGAAAEGFAFKGILFIGLMLTAEGPKVLEYNVRFGDPETQAILIRLQTDLAAMFEGVVEGNLANIDVKWSDQSSACVVVASAGYPGKYETGIPITGLEGVSGAVEVFHAGTKMSGNTFLTAGGRVLGITSTGKTLAGALDNCYRAIEEIHWTGMQYRRDIGRFRDFSVASH